MKIRMLTGLSGIDFSLSADDETDRFEGEEAGRLIDAGYAVPVVEEKVERAVKQHPAREKRG